MSAVPDELARPGAQDRPAAPQPRPAAPVGPVGPWAALRADRAANTDGLSTAVLAVFRFGQWAAAARPPLRGPASAFYKVANLLLLRLGAGVDLPAGLVCGPGLRLHHGGRGVAVNRQAVLGAGIELFQGVAIGNKDATGCPRLGDGVLVGAGAVILGPVEIGAGARIGAGALVVSDVPAGGSAIAPPARVFPPRS